jgi:hypothetical protein
MQIPYDGKFVLPDSIWFNYGFQQTIIIIAATSFILMLISSIVTYIFKSQIVVKRRGSLFIFLMLLGILLVPVSMVISVVTPSKVTCNAMVWIPSLGWALCNLSYIGREILLIQIFSKSHAFQRQSSTKLYRISIAVIIIGLSTELVTNFIPNVFW